MKQDGQALKRLVETVQDECYLASSRPRLAPQPGFDRVAPDATAFPHRRANLELFAMASWDLATDGKRHTDYVKDYWAKLLPFTDGYYVNEVADEHQPKIDENYRGNIGRLRQIKRQYDPQNMFRLNANILPA